MRCLRLALDLASICVAVSFATTTWAQTPIVIGISAPLTGVYAIEGHQIVEGARLAIDSINSQGGIRGRRLDGVFLDTANDPGRAVAEAQRVIEANKAVALVGYPLSGEALAVKRVAREKNVLMITLNTAPEVTDDNTKSVLRVIGRADTLATMVADYVAANFANSTVGVQSSGATVAFNTVLHQQLNVKNIRVNLSETVSPKGSRVKTH